MSLEISQELNLIAICGQNNVGKTNTLRAINLFFHPETYVREVDMPKIKWATGGQSTNPKIDLTLLDDGSDTYYAISRDFKIYSEVDNGLSGISYKLDGKKKVEKSSMTTEEIEEILSQIEFVYIESINTFVPDLIEKITDGIINVEYDRARFSQSKKALKAAYDTYIDGLSEILGAFADDISDTFKNFRDNWKVEFVVPKNSETFRDLISKDVYLSLDDDGSIGILDKGAGLQRLATILLNFEMLARINKQKDIIICIDEPDAYLHEGLQRKLKNLFDEKSSNMQIFFTTHSKVFINEYNMRNVFLLDSRYYNKYSVRKKKDVSVKETFLVNINENDGYEKICDHLGIEKVSYELLEKNNILVEGKCDKKYLSELLHYFALPCPNIESLNGADNAIKYLDFYDSYYRNNTVQYKPKVKIVFDNDAKGREIFNKVKAKSYNNIDVTPLILQNHMNSGNITSENNNTNNEIEDFIYPEVIVYLINCLLEKKNMTKIASATVCKKIHTASFATKGIMELCEHEKNSKNPNNGAEISFVSSGEQTNRVKDGLAGMFNLQANRKLLSILDECNRKYPDVKMLLSELSSFE
jgi:predicted ATP-dependent endonuclease of OLD family